MRRTLPERAALQNDRTGKHDIRLRRGGEDQNAASGVRMVVVVARQVRDLPAPHDQRQKLLISFGWSSNSTSPAFSRGSNAS